MRWIVHLILELVFLVFGVEGVEPNRVPPPGTQRRHFLIRYLIGLGIALLIFASLAGLMIVVANVAAPVGLAIMTIVLVGLFGLMIAAVRYYRWP
jgi:hypothetical protein